MGGVRACERGRGTDSLPPCEGGALIGISCTKFALDKRPWYSIIWKLPENWADVESALLYPLTPDGRGKPVRLTTADRAAAPRLLPQVPYVLVPEKR